MEGKEQWSRKVSYNSNPKVQRLSDFWMQCIYPLEDDLNSNVMLKSNKDDNHIIWEDYDHWPHHTLQKLQVPWSHIWYQSPSQIQAVLFFDCSLCQQCSAKWIRKTFFNFNKTPKADRLHYTFTSQPKRYLWEQRQIQGTKVVMLEIFDLFRLEVTFKGNHFTANYICHFMS